MLWAGLPLKEQLREGREGYQGNSSNGKEFFFVRKEIKRDTNDIKRNPTWRRYTHQALRKKGQAVSPNEKN